MFCKTVWNGLHILPDGYIRLCSLGTNTDMSLDMQRARDKDGKVMHILTHSIQEIMNSDKHREVRLFNKNNPDLWSPHCKCCENREIVTNFDRNHPNKSRRIYLMKMDTDEIVSEKTFNNKADNNGIIDWMPNSLDIRFGNLCNQKCIMCSPTYSNQWYDEWFEYYNINKFGSGIPITIHKNKNNMWEQPTELRWFEDERWWKKFEEIMPSLKHIYITGGEPMVTPAHDIMLDKLIQSGFSENIWLEYDTNASAINNKIIDKWYKFKKVDIRVSMDAIGKQYELIRYGGKWDKFKKNVLKLKKLSIESDRKISLMSLSTCFQISTIYSIIESEEFCNSINVPLHLRFLEGPYYMSVASLPLEIKQQIINYYNIHKDRTSKYEMIIKHLNKISQKDINKNTISEYFKFMNFLDSKRNTDWKNVFHNVYSLLKDYADESF